MNYIANCDTIIFNPELNDELDIRLISNYAKLIFSDYALDEKLFEHYSNNNFKSLKYEGSKFNQDVSNLPQGLIHLTFGYEFNQDVSKLPQGLIHLTFGSYFNQDVSKLPSNITHLTFGYAFNQDVSNLPSNLTHLIFGWYFNQNVSKLPLSLTH